MRHMSHPPPAAAAAAAAAAAVHPTMRGGGEAACCLLQPLLLQHKHPLPPLICCAPPSKPALLAYFKQKPHATAKMSDSAKLDKILEALASVGKRCSTRTARAAPPPHLLHLPSLETLSLDTLESKVVVGGASSAAAATASGGSGDVAPFVDGTCAACDPSRLWPA
jgi:hypothetical protein